MKYLITGGMGFVGSHLFEQLLKYDADVKIFDIYSEKSYFDFMPREEHRIIGDVCNYDEVLQAMEGRNIVFHLAGVLGTDYLMSYPKLAVETNIIGTINVLEAAKKTGATICYLSLLPEWLNFYMLTKNTSAKLCEIYYKEFGVKTIVLRASHIYGARQKWKPVVKAIPNFILSSIENKPVTVYGNGHQLMDLLYIDDAIEGIIKSTEIKSAYGKSIQFGSGITHEVASVAKKIISLCKSHSEIKYKKMRPGEPDDPTSFTPVDTRDQFNLLGFKAKIDIEIGLNKTIDWYRKFSSKE